MTATATPLSPPFGDSGRQGREVEPLWRASPTTLPADQGHSLSPLVKDTALILTRRAGQVCSACHSIGFRTVSRFTAVVRESPLPLCLLFLDAHDNRRMFLPVAGICCRCRGVCFLVSIVDKLRMPRRCQPVNHTVPNVSRSSPPFKPCVRCCD